MREEVVAVKRRNDVSLSEEVLDLEQAVAGVAMLVNTFAAGGLPFEGDAREAPAAIGALLLLVQRRLRLVQRCITGEVDVELLWDRHNDAAAGRREHDLVLRSRRLGRSRK